MRMLQVIYGGTVHACYELADVLFQSLSPMFPTIISDLGDVYEDTLSSVSELEFTRAIEKVSYHGVCKCAVSSDRVVQSLMSATGFLETSTPVSARRQVCLTCS